MTYKPFVKVPNLTQAGCTRQNRPGRDALIDLGHGSLILFRQNKADVPGPKGRDSLMSKGRDSLMSSAVKSAKRHAEIAVASSVNALSP